jgi:hypothetical protein
MYLLYTFILATLLSLVVIVSKMREVNTSRQTLVGRMLRVGDPLIQSVVSRFRKLVSKHWERTFFLFLVHIPSRMETFFGSMKKRGHDYYHGVNEKVRDRRDLGDSSVSPYMRSMSLRRDGDTPQV